MSWTAVVPLKCDAERKTRLAGRLPSAARQALSDQMAGHVLGVLEAAPEVARVVCLSPLPFKAQRISWRGDQGRGLNKELAAFRAARPTESLLVVHADLPLLGLEDITALITAAAGGAAIAPDRFSTGTNALALSPSVRATFAFGADSFAAHRAAITPAPEVVRREGLELDVDTPQDLDLAMRCGAPLAPVLNLARLS